MIDGKIVEGWFMCDELAMLIQLESQMPKRKDGHIVAPHVNDEGEAPDALLERLVSQSTQQERNKAKVVRSKSTSQNPEDRANCVRTRWGMPQLREYGERNGVAQVDMNHAFPDRSDRIVRILAESDKVWMRFNIRGTNTQSFYGLPPTGKGCVISEVGIARFAGDEWADDWYLADALGALLQLGALDVLEKLGCKRV